MPEHRNLVSPDLVTRSCTVEIRRIGREDPELSRLLERAVRTGIYCVYDPLWR